MLRPIKRRTGIVSPTPPGWLLRSLQTYSRLSPGHSSGGVFQKTTSRAVPTEMPTQVCFEGGPGQEPLSSQKSALTVVFPVANVEESTRRSCLCAQQHESRCGLDLSPYGNTFVAGHKLQYLQYILQCMVEEVRSIFQAGLFLCRQPVKTRQIPILKLG